VWAGAVLIYTFHPLVSGRGHRMKMMDQLIRYCKGKGVIFATVEEAAAMAKSWKDEGGAPLLENQQRRLEAAGAKFAKL